MKIGILALQGAFREHREVLSSLGAECVEVRVPVQLDAVDAMVLPGGESTTMGRLLVTSGLLEPLRARIAEGLPVFATCAGVILLAAEVVDGRPDQPTLGGLHCSVRRNAYGTQLQSFEADLAIPDLPGGTFPGVFIRAPVIERAGPAVEVVTVYDGRPVLVRQGEIWGSTFHPELSGDLRLHHRFLAEVGS